MKKLKIKKILSVLIVSLLLIGCSENRILIDELTNKGTKENPIMYNEEGLLTGIAFDMNGNDKLFSEESYKKGKRNGLSKFWHKNGQLKEEGNYINGEKDGLWIIKDEYGQLIEKGNYINGNKDGSWKYWYSDYYQMAFDSQMEVDYELGLNSQESWNEWLSFYPFGQLKKEENYTNGKRDGKWKEWYYHGQLNVKIFGNDKSDGYEISLNSDELIELLVEISPQYTSSQIIHKVLNGQIKSVRNFADDDQVGIEKQWHRNGQIKYMGNFADGYPVGMHKWWHENGQLKEKGNVINGRLEYVFD